MGVWWKTVTELALNHHLDGQEASIPLVAPTPSHEGLNRLLNRRGFSDSKTAKAGAFARPRMSKELPFFALPEERCQLPHSRLLGRIIKDKKSG
jgi:hypothetical protein